MKTPLFIQHTSAEIMKMIEGLEGLNDDDVKESYGVDTVAETETLLWEEYEEAVGTEAEYEGVDCFQSHGFTRAYDYNSFRY